MSFSGSTFGRFTGRYMIIMGVFFVVLGVGAAIALGGLPYAGGGMLLMGGIFVIVGGAVAVIGFIVNRGASSTEQVLAAGVAGTATITGVTQTGMYLNEQPRIKMDLLVQLPGQAPYAAEHTEFVPLILLSRVQPGATLPVKVNPAQPQKVVVDWQGLPAMGFGAGDMGAPGMATAAGAFPPPPAASMGPGSGMDESLSQVQAALATSGAAVPAAFASPEQGGYTIEPAARLAARQRRRSAGPRRFPRGHGQDRRRRTAVHDGADADGAGQCAAEAGALGGDGARCGDGQAAPGHDPAGQGGGRKITSS